MATARRRLTGMFNSSSLRARHEAMAEFLSAALTSMLGIGPSECGMRDNFMDLGMNSLKAVEFKLLLEEELDLALGSSLLFDYPNLESLVDFLLQEVCGRPKTGMEVN